MGTYLQYEVANNKICNKLYIVTMSKLLIYKEKVNNCNEVNGYN